MTFEECLSNGGVMGADALYNLLPYFHSWEQLLKQDDASRRLMISVRTGQSLGLSVNHKLKPSLWLTVYLCEESERTEEYNSSLLNSIGYINVILHL